jgi:hypothetical protein
MSGICFNSLSSQTGVLQTNAMPAIKRQRIGEMTNKSSFCLKVLHQTIFKIISYLSEKDLLSFELVCKGHQELTHLAWQTLRKKEFLLFDWKACEEQQYKERWNYVLGSVFVKFCDTYFLYNERSLETAYKLNKWKKQLSGLIQRFPTFGAFIEFHIYHNASQAPIYSKEVKKQRAIILENAIEGKWGGDLLLQSLIELQQDNADELLIIEYLSQCINQKATYASLIAVDLLSTETLTLAFQAAEEGDFRALEKLVKEFNQEEIMDLYNQGIIYPPILACLARHL